MQAIKRQITKIGIQPKNPSYNVFRVALQLPHLPAAKIPEGVKVAVAYIKEYSKEKDAAEIFERYLKTQWVRNINPLIYSAYKIKHTTNNAAECFHSKLLREVGASPSPWVFVGMYIFCMGSITYYATFLGIRF